MKVLTLTTDLNHPGFIQFKKFYNHFGYEIEVLNPSVSGFGEQMPYIIEWCKKNRRERVMYVDAWDTIALAPMTEIFEKIPLDAEFYGGAERGCWPDGNLVGAFPNLELPYKYPCGGTWIANTDWLIEMAERFPNVEKHNDQHWLQLVFLKSLKEGRDVQLDNFGEVFQSLMLDPVEAFKIENGRVENILHQTQPVIIHGNGKVNMERYYNIL
jgi:hypothetical protein